MNVRLDNATLTVDDMENTFLLDWFSNILICPLSNDAITRYQVDAVVTFIKDLGESLQCQEVATSIIDELSRPDVDTTQYHLNYSYTLLFEGVSGPRSISLCESAYYGDRSRLFQEPFIEMREIFQKLNVSVESNCKEPADHISLELAALAEALKQHKIDIAIALHQRLIRWVPQLVADVKKVQSTNFYHNILFLLNAYLTTFDDYAYDLTK